MVPLVPLVYLVALLLITPLAQTQLPTMHPKVDVWHLTVLTYPPPLSATSMKNKMGHLIFIPILEPLMTVPV
jgi:hypothetical protein